MGRFIFVTLLGSLVLASVTLAQPAKIGSTPNGDGLQAPDGKTLYVYDGDKIDLGQQGKSSCDGECARLWPPFAAPANARASGDWSLITRPGGEKQWAYKGRPLYTWSQDKAPGVVNGNGSEGNSWHIAKP